MQSPQRIRYVRTDDGIQLAWAEAGTGPVLVKAANWLTHLTYDWDSPVWRHWIRFFAGNFRFIRYDERGCGMTDWQVGDLSFERWVADLETVVAQAEARRFVLLGISQGAATCVAYAAKHPERVSHLVLYGGYVRGAAVRTPHEARELCAIVELVRLGWGREHAAFRDLFTSRFIPNGTDEQIRWFSELCRKTTSPEIAGEPARTTEPDRCHGPAGPREGANPRTPCPRRAAVPLAEGRLIASGISSAQFVELDSRNHILLEHEPAWERFCAAVSDFTGIAAPADAENPAFASLSPRERRILSLLTEGLSNASIAERLALSDKTVRNHISNIFDKLGVWSRAEAIVFTRDRHFRKDQA